MSIKIQNILFAAAISGLALGTVACEDPASGVPTADVKDAVKKAGDKAVKKAGDAKDAAKEAGADAKDAVKAAGADAKDAVKAAGADAKDAVKDAAAKAGDKATDVAKAGADKVDGAADAMKVALKDGWAINAADSKVEWEGSKVSGSHKGGFKTFNGAVKLGADNKIEGGMVELKIDMKSLHSDDGKLTGHLAGEDFFENEKYPTATFESTKVEAKAAEIKGKKYTHLVTGKLTLHGVTKEISFPANITLDGKTVTATTEFAINRKDFNIKYAGKADDLIRDNVVIRFTVKATGK